MVRNLTFSDRLVGHLDNALKTLTPHAVSARAENPAKSHEQVELNAEQTKHVTGLMRINHTGEVCAQALYQGQALTARLPDVRQEMADAADEELDHLAWCEQRLTELGGKTSILNPAFYGLSYALGAAAGIAGDKWSLGFVAATEDQVSEHLKSHLVDLRPVDPKSTAIVEQMLLDEERHAQNALDAGGVVFPEPIKMIMKGMSKVMTTTTYRV